MDFGDDGAPEASGTPRRNVLKGGVLGALSVPFAAMDAQAAADGDAPPVDTMRLVAMTINGRSHRARIDPRTTLVDFLRNEVGLTGTKIGCAHGQCGACTALVNGSRVNTCLMLAVSLDGADITTIEGLSPAGGRLHPMQRAFIAHDALQCGYCTPGQLMSAVACIEEGHAGSPAEIREYMSGNLCRCGAYTNIVTAIEAVRDGQFTDAEDV